ncbi:MAG: alpha/beta hydrolase [Spirochaetales bacterium]|nr:alpha/beta hydrolase [Spirochaetales bacterium]
MKEYLIDSQGATLRYHEFEGEDMPILFIHGLGCSSSFEFPQVASCSHLQNHRRILVDLLGSGYSDHPESFSYTVDAHAQYLEKFVKSFDLPKWSIYGHSMGGAIAIDLAYRLGTLVQNLMLGEANLDFGGGFFSQKIASYESLDYVEYGHSQMIQQNLENANSQWATTLQHTKPQALYQQAQSLIKGHGMSWREKLTSLCCNRSFVFGEYSLPDPDFDVLKQEGITVDVLPSSGHSLSCDNPEGLAKILKKNMQIL